MPDTIELEDGDLGGRFRVNRVDSRVIHRDTGPLADEDVHSGNNSHQSSYYGTQYLKSLRYLTREVLPKEEYYRDDFENAYRPGLDDLHVATTYEKHKTVDPEANAGPALKGKVIKLGWIRGVYMLCLLNIWGVMLFLRMSWVVGQAGVGLGLVIIVLANIVTIITSLSMSAVSTNGQIKAGGIYYMISRSLGPEFGAAIGLMFTMSNSIAVAMYVVGFCESLNSLLLTNGLKIVDNGLNDIRIVGSITLVVLLIIAFVGMEWVTRSQIVLLIILVLSQVDFIIGYFIGPTGVDEEAKGFLGISQDLLKENFYPDFREENGVQHNFFTVFTVFFPAVTGIVAGANMSGDLKDPSSAIPKGTLLAIFTTVITYIVYPIMLGSSVMRDASGNMTAYLSDNLETITACVNTTGGCPFGLQNSADVMELVSGWGPLIYGGCFAATLSSAIASLVGAPRVLQALANDKLYPFLGFFGKGYGANNDPFRGYILCFIVAFLCVMIGELNAIAPLTSNFFLAAYTLINFSCFHASITKSPGWRPAFKMYNAWISLIGCLLCMSVMFLSDWTTALVTFVVTLSLYLFVSYRKPDVNWGSSTQAQTYVSALKSCHELSLTEDHVKNYRPQILVMSGFPGSRPALIDFANLITKNLSLLVCGDIIKSNLSQRSKNLINAQASKWLKRHKLRGFYNFFQDDDFEHGTRALLQITGMGKLRPNMILLGYKSNWQTCDKEEVKSYFNVIHNAFDSYMAVGILRLPDQLDYSGVLADAGGFESTLATIEEKTTDKPSETQSLLSNDKTNDTRGEEDEADDSPPSSPEVSRKPTDLSKKKKNGKRSSFSNFYTGRGGKPLSKEIINNITRFRRKQNEGFIDVWWLYDDGGLTLLLPYIIQARSVYSACKLRIFSLANKKEALDMEQKNLAALLSKFRIDYSDVVVIPDVTKRAKDSSREEFENLIKNFKENEEDEGNDDPLVISEAELLALKEKNNRHIRLRELLQEHSKDSSLVVMTLPMPRKGTVSAFLYMSWLETLTKDMPPILLVRGNQTSVLTFYS